MGFNETLSDLGDGLANFLTKIKDPTADFVLLLAIVGGVVAIFLGIASVIKRAIRKGAR